MSNFCTRIVETAEKYGRRPAIQVLRGAEIETTTYDELVAEASHIASWLTAAGLAPGERAAILADNDARWVGTYLGILWMGGVAVPLDTAYKAAQVHAVIESSGARLLLTTAKYLETARAGVAQVGDGGPRVELLGALDRNQSPHALFESPSIAVLLYTSGTTADPKGVVLTHDNLDAERSGALAIVDAGPDDAVLGVLPLFHALAQMANLLLPLTVGARVVFLESISSTTLLAALQSQNITIFACVPQFFYLIHQRVQTEVAHGGRLRRNLFRLLLDTNVRLRDRFRWNPGRRIFARVHRALGSQMRLLITGGSRFDPAIARDLYGMGFSLLNAYGLTETSGGATIVRPGDRFTTSVGQPFPGVEIKIGPRAASAADNDNAEGVPDGEVMIRGPIVMREYFNRADATTEAIVDGWLHTGDLGRLDSEGRLFITGRSKEIIVLASGKNLYPEEIEAHYRQTPFVKELCVLGLARPGEPAAERLHAVIVPDEAKLRERQTVNVRELIRFELETLSVQLPAHKRILSYDISLEPLPRTTTGKIKRPEVERRVRELRARAAAGAAERALTTSEREWLDDPAHAAILVAIAERLDRKPAALPPDANLELDLGLDSMERVELLTFLEQRESVRVTPAVRATIFTVRQLVEAVRGSEVTGSEVAGSEVGGVAWDAILWQPADAHLVENLKKPKPIVAAVCWTIIQIVGFVFRVLTGVRSRGQENLPKSGPFILCPNHQTYVDGGFIALSLPFRTLRQLFFVGAAEFYQTPTSAFLGRSINIVPVDPDANLVTAMRAGAAGLRLKKVLMLFPEGEREIDGELKPFRKGAAILSAHLDAPMIPVAVDGLYDLWPRGRKFNWKGLLPWRAKRITVAFGAPLAAGRGEYAEGTAALSAAVGALIAQSRR